MKYLVALSLVPLVALAVFAADALQKDVFATSGGDLEITFIGHGSLMLRFGSLLVHVDPYGKLADYRKLPKADLVLITHQHQDHLDPVAIEAVRKRGTKIILNQASLEKVPGGLVMQNGDVRKLLGITIEAVPAYNIVHKRENGEPFHPRGLGNGYVLTFGDKRVYLSGDTENIPEMRNLGPIDIAFLPMNLPYTMTPEMAADAARMIRPRVLYPYHFGDTDTARIVSLLRDSREIEVRLRNMK